MKIHDKNTNLWITVSERHKSGGLRRYKQLPYSFFLIKYSFRYESIQEFYEAYKKLKTNDFGNILIQREDKKDIEFKFVKHSKNLSILLVKIKRFN